MGIINVTPDSFSDGGRFFDPAAAIARAKALIAEGADLLDIGGESTRPRAEPVPETEEIARVVPLIAAIRAASDVPISIDTMKPAVARAAMAAGATIWNDVTALTFAPDSPATAAALGCGVILMHMQGRPADMQDDPRYSDVASEVADYLEARAAAAMAAGVRREAIRIDPGLGFGKTAAHSLALLGQLDRIIALGFPVVLGASRKSFIGGVDGAARPADDRLGGSLAAALAGARAGVAVVRVHDVRQTRQALAVQAAIAAAGA
ncbi:MAG TPA: dihydropteroate synthase [Caulobacteraceae bacterium]|nr:dihydropteroate synthase [Caulobacteraceae bacterium]